MADRILVTGTGSGLGQALLEQLGTSELTRADDPAALKESTPYDAIVHCAFDHSPKDDAHSKKYCETPICLTRFPFILSRQVFWYLFFLPAHILYMMYMAFMHDSYIIHL